MFSHPMFAVEQDRSRKKKNINYYSPMTYSCYTRTNDRQRLSDKLLVYISGLSARPPDRPCACSPSTRANCPSLLTRCRRELVQFFELVQSLPSFTFYGFVQICGTIVWQWQGHIHRQQQQVEFSESTLDSMQHFCSATAFIHLSADVA